MKLGVTTVVRGNDIVAIDVRPIPARARSGLSPYDLAPNSTMTNGVLEGTEDKAANGNVITVNYGKGKVKVLVPPGTPMSRAAPGTRSDIKPGVAFYAATIKGKDGKLTAVRLQVGKGGVVFVLTLGTGVGSGMFNEGKLVPNTELGHMEIRGRDAEKRSASASKVRRGLSWKAWAQDLDEHLMAIEKLFSPTLIILGGGVSKSADKFIPRLTVRVPVLPAQLRNDAGIVGAAMAAAERGGRAGS